MLRRISISLLLVVSVNAAKTQGLVDSLKTQLLIQKNDTSKIVLNSKLSYYYDELDPDSAAYFAEEHRLLAQKLNLKLHEAIALTQLGYASLNQSRYNSALQFLISAKAIGEEKISQKDILPPHYLVQLYPEKLHSPEKIRMVLLASVHHNLGHLYTTLEKYPKALDEYYLAKSYAEKLDIKAFLQHALMNIGRAYKLSGNYNKALYYENKAYELSNTGGNKKYQSNILANLGDIYFNQKDLQTAKKYFDEAVSQSILHDNLRSLVWAYEGLATVSLAAGQSDRALNYAHQSLALAKSIGFERRIFIADTVLASIHQARGQYDSAFFYYKRGVNRRDQLYNAAKEQELDNILLSDLKRRADIETARKEYRNKLQLYGTIAIILFFIIIAFIFWRNSQQRKKANQMLLKQKNSLEQTLGQLKATQAQLIQSEKMASLGELTAGIAHEIQNPLNFVNNFSEVNTELIDELKAEIANNNMKEANVIADDIKENEQKINHHGKRADAIVKGMLQHSRSSSGKTEATDINALTDEYLRLAYHGMRAKDKAFNANLVTDYDEGLGSIHVIQQDFGRAILNLITNAFYAVKEKALSAKKSSDKIYEATVTVTTKKLDNAVVISVKDNGTGIPQKVVDKIFQPFYSTKPTGEGTGLGLSITYDIIKAHGGELKVDSKEGEGAEFIIRLRATDNNTSKIKSLNNENIGS
jgi:two-component system, NtrC family, sensor kinase